ncbi:protein VAC14 homolog [Acanthaster planci]|uniref:Protein VAC14 homolog n=1 Tax=Acanthaster planci TaxID=133434 RepID=A0A8B7YMT2_ACAPL|nr:protein VAC14 homolog [Acanthaster planci]
MADRVQDFGPMTPACARALSDKLYEKRKGAALEIERLVRDLMQTNSTDQIDKLLQILGSEFTLSANGHARKGGLIGLAALAIGMGKESTAYLPQLIQPVIACFSDPDNRTRYFACEALYNIVKIARSAVLLHFNTVFTVLSQLAADPDINVKNGSELLDRLMKDIVTESQGFDLVAFVPLLRDRIYSTNSFVRQFLLSWITTLNSVPDINLIVYLPEILDGMFHILGDPNKEIRKMCEFCLDHFMQEMKQLPSSVDYAPMVNILIAHSQSNDEVIQLTAINWLLEFLNQAGRTMIPFCSGLLNAVTPCMAYDDINRKSIKEAAKLVNQNLMRLVTAEDDRDDDEAEAKCLSTSPLGPRAVRLDIAPTVEVLTRCMQHNSMQCKITSLRWTYHLHMKTPRKIFQHVEDIFPVLVRTLSDTSDEVVLLDLEVLAEVVSSPAGPAATTQRVDSTSQSTQRTRAASGTNAYFHKFMTNLLELFASDRQLLEDRGSFIVRQLCLLLNTEDIYWTLSEILVNYKDLQFATEMVQTLNSILLTATELFELRTQLKDLNSESSCKLFCCLYKSWCHSPIATVSLCFLTQNYKHASSLIYSFGDLEVTVHFLTEIDKLVQLLESPIFTYLRLQLLDTEHNQHLVKSLYGVLMLLPQSTAFTTLQRRLACVPNMLQVPRDQKKNPGLIPDKRPFVKAINWEEMLTHFTKIQAEHKTKRARVRSTEEQLQSFKL